MWGPWAHNPDIGGQLIGHQLINWSADDLEHQLSHHVIAYITSFPKIYGLLGVPTKFSEKSVLEDFTL